ncbi:MAG: FecR domain-containing protein [Acidovorax sp.]
MQPPGALTDMIDRSPTGLDGDGIAQAAADWIVRLSADDPAEREQVRVGFEAWKRADPRHAAAAAAMERFIDQTRSLRGEGPRRPARAALSAVVDAPAIRPRGARRATRLLSLVLVLALPAVFALHAFAPADLRTATGEQRQQWLADGSHLTLGTASAVNYRLSSDLRRVELLNGEILVEVAKDAARPFVVETEDGRIRALGTRFIVRREAGSTLLAMLESATLVHAGTAGAANTLDVKVSAGEQVRISARGVEKLGAIDAAQTQDAFVHRRLLVKDRPLPEVLDELARNRSGFIRYERERLKDIRVSAVLPLDDTNRALRLLADNFPQLRVRTLTPWIVLVDRAP